MTTDAWRRRGESEGSDLPVDEVVPVGNDDPDKAVGRKAGRHNRHLALVIISFAAGVMATIGVVSLRSGKTDRAADRPPASTTSSLAPRSGTSAGAPLARADNQGDFINGHQFAYITSVNVDRRTITFDAAQWFTGEEARKAVIEDDPNGDDEIDYAIRNSSPRLRTMSVRPDAQIRVLKLVNEVGDTDLAGLADDMADPERTSSEGDHYFGFWLTIDGGKIVGIVEQYTP